MSGQAKEAPLCLAVEPYMLLSRHSQLPRHTSRSRTRNRLGVPKPRESATSRRPTIPTTAAQGLEPRKVASFHKAKRRGREVTRARITWWTAKLETDVHDTPQDDLEACALSHASPTQGRHFTHCWERACCNRTWQPVDGRGDGAWDLRRGS